MSGRTGVTAFLFTLTVAVLPVGAAAREQAARPPATCPLPPAEASVGAGIHAALDALVRAFVRDGDVDYRCFQTHEAALDDYIATLGRTDPGALSRDEALAFWINAYNAFTIKLILSRYPRIGSVKDIPRRWDRRDWVVGGRRRSLNDIEHDILRKEFAEPRIHFAIVCASASCPKLASEAYAAGRLDEQLTRSARDFVADPIRGVRVEVERRGTDGGRARVHLSSIFKWFREDFEARTGSLIDFILPYLAPEDRGVLELRRNDVSIRFLPYDWTLNDSRPAAP